MLILRRQEGQWIRATHQSGDVLWIKFYDIVPGCDCCGRDGQLQVGFDDAAHNFQIDRPDRNPVPDGQRSPDVLPPNDSFSFDTRTGKSTYRRGSDVIPRNRR